MLGASCVGKTSLVQRYVRSIFSDEYLSSVGVKVSKKTFEDPPMNLLLWDLEGQDDYCALNVSYIKGAAGLLFVIDGTRGETLSVALMLRNAALELLGHDVPHLLLINKEDIKDEWEITDKVLTSLKNSGFTVLESSAKSGLNVEAAFEALAEMML
jgi:small GTP-binding protein